MIDKNVLTFDLKVKAQRRCSVKQRTYNKCNHSTMLADEHNKVLECKDCGFIMSAWDYVLAIAKKEDSVFSHLKYARMEKERLEQDLIGLKRKINNAKAQIKRSKK